MYAQHMKNAHQPLRKCTLSTTGAGISNHWTGIWNGMMEWKMEWNGEHTQLQLTRVTGTAQSRLNYLVYL